MRVGESNAAVQRGDVFEQLTDMAQLASAARDDDAANQFALESAVFDLVVHVLDDFSHARLNDARDVAPGDLFGRPPGQAGNDHDFVLGHFLLEGRAEFALERFGVLFQHAAALLDVVRDGVASKGNDSGVADDALLKDGDVGGAATDVHQGDAGFLFFFAQHSAARGDGLEDQLVHLQARPLDAAVDVFGSGGLPGDDVEVGLQPHPGVPHGLLDPGFSIHGEFLGQNVQDFLSRQHLQLAHVINELLHI